jgi:hypothetical protein
MVNRRESLAVERVLLAELIGLSSRRNSASGPAFEFSRHQDPPAASASSSFE